MQIRVVHKITGEINPGVVVALTKIIEVRPLFLLHVIDVESDLTPLIDDVDAGHFVGLSHVPVLEREGKPFRHSGFFEQSSRFLARRFDVLSESGELNELGFRYGELGAGPEKPAYVLHHRDLRERLRCSPSIDRKSEGASNSHVVERFLFVIERHRQITDPGTLLDDDLVPGGFYDVIARRRIKATKFNERLPASHRRDARRRVANHDGSVAIEIRPAFYEIIGVLLADPV